MAKIHGSHIFHISCFTTGIALGVIFNVYIATCWGSVWCSKLLNSKIELQIFWGHGGDDQPFLKNSLLHSNFCQWKRKVRCFKSFVLLWRSKFAKTDFIHKNRSKSSIYVKRILRQAVSSRRGSWGTVRWGFALRDLRLNVTLMQVFRIGEKKMNVHMMKDTLDNLSLRVSHAEAIIAP